MTATYMSDNDLRNFIIKINTPKLLSLEDKIFICYMYGDNLNE